MTKEEALMLIFENTSIELYPSEEIQLENALQIIIDQIKAEYEQKTLDTEK